MVMSDTLAGWDELQRSLNEAEAEKPHENSDLTDRILDTLRAPVPRWVVLVSVAVTGLVVFAATLFLGVKNAPQEPPPAAAMTLPTATPIPPTPTVTPRPTPTPLPRLVVWAPGGACAYVRPAPDSMAEPLDCLPNGTEVTWTGQQKEHGGLTWAEVGFPTDYGLASGWMAYGVVAWDFSPNTATGNRETAFYDADRGSIVRWLSPHTPILLDHEQDGYAWVQLPNGEWGWVTVKDLDLGR